MSFFGNALKWLSGGSVGASLAKVAILGFTSKLLSNNTDPGKNANQETPDPGVRLQLNPDTENKLPVLYGSAYFGGYITDAVLSADYKTMTYCLSLCEQTTTGTYTFNNVYINNNRVVFRADGVTVDYTLDSSGNQDISLRDLVKVYMYAGAPLQPAGSAGTTPAAHTVMPGWTELTHPMTGVVYAIVEVKYSRGGNTGVPNCTFHLTNSLTAPGSVLSDYIQNTRYGAGIAASDLDTSFASLDAYAAAGFTYTDLDSNPQTSAITVNGLIDTKNTVLDNMTKLAEAANSWLSYNVHTGEWGVVINRAGTSVASFSDNNIIGEITISGTSLTQLNNIADVRYQNTDILDTADYVKISIDPQDLFENEVPKTLQMTLPYTNNQVTATHIGLQALKQARVDKVITFTADFSYVNLTAGSLIDVTSSVLGYTNKMFRVITAQEQEADDGAIVIQFTCLEYSADVYTYDITEYAVETDDGILGIGSIGTPNTPTVTKVEQANVPKLVINTVVPSGIVEAIEYWITFDVGVPNDADRSYINIGTYSLPSGELLTEDAVIDFTYSQLGQANFFVKVRGVNRVVNGPYSTPTGLIEYVPVVVADTVSDEPVSIGGQLMSLGLLTLLNNVDELLKVFNGEKGIKDALKDIFFGGGANDPDDAAALLSADPAFTDGIATTLANDPNFISSVGSATVDIGNYSIDALNDVDTTTVAPSEGSLLAWDGSNWVVSTFDPGNSTASVTPVTPPVEPPIVTYYLNYANKYPNDKATWANEGAPSNWTAPQLAPQTGSYYLVLSGTNTPVEGIFSDMVINPAKTARLYKSDGTLVETLSGSSMSLHDRLLELPFANREYGINYYILVDQGLVTYCEYESVGITSPTTWNFNTPPYIVEPYIEPVAFFDVYDFGPAPTIPGLVYYISSPFCTDDNIIISVNKQFKAGPGFNLQLSRVTETGNETVYTFSPGEITFTSTTITIPVGAFTLPGNTYNVTWTSNTFVTDPIVRAPRTATVCGVEFTETVNDTAIVYNLPTYNNNFTIQPDLAFVYLTAETPSDMQNVYVQSHISIVFNKSVSLGPTTPGVINLYKQGGVLHQSFDVRTAFNPDFTSEIITISGNTVKLNPTKDLSANTVYYITIDSGVFVGACGDSLVGWSDTTTATFKTQSGPVVISTTPADGVESNVIGEPISITYSSNIIPGPGKIKIYDGADNLLSTLDTNSSAVTIQ